MTAAELLTSATRIHERALPFLQPGDDWRADADGVPPLEDVLIACARVLGEFPRMRINDNGHPFSTSASFELSYQLCKDGWEVGHSGTGIYESGESPAEAGLALLDELLDTTCAECKVWDGHMDDCSGCI